MGTELNEAAADKIAADFATISFEGHEARALALAYFALKQRFAAQGEALAAARETLIRCAVISGEDGEAVDAARSGAMKHPTLEEWAVGCVSQLRADYDEGVRETNEDRAALRAQCAENYERAERAEVALAAAQHALHRIEAQGTMAVTGGVTRSDEAKIARAALASLSDISGAAE